MGTDIPEGICSFYSGTGYEVRVVIYAHGKRETSFETSIQYITERMLDGYELLIENDITMVKQPNLSFE